MLEFAGGKNGKTQQKEWYVYVFDTLPILIVVLLYNIWFPGNYLKHLGFKQPKEHHELNSDPEAAELR